VGDNLFICATNLHPSGFSKLWQTLIIFLSKKNLFCSKRVFVFILLPYDVTKLKKIFEWWRRLWNNFEKKEGVLVSLE
jgi:hypothetical protein